MTDPEVFFDLEIRQLKKVSDQVSTTCKDAFNVIAGRVMHGNKLICTGVGKSGLMAKRLADTLASIGIQAFFFTPSDLLHGCLGVVKENDVFIMISKSGETSELKDLTRRVADNHEVIAITSPNSYLSMVSDVVIDSTVDEETTAINNLPTASLTVVMVIGNVLTAMLVKYLNITEYDYKRYHPS
jgi:arabinose-5-phosphate isomerase